MVNLADISELIHFEQKDPKIQIFIAGTPGNKILLNIKSLYQRTELSFIRI